MRKNSGHVLKFVSFVTKNSLFPFSVKKMVLEAALLSTILYSCESWLTNNFKPMRTMYFGVIKALLGVRRTTANGLCLLEVGFPSVDGHIKNAQYRFFHKIITTRNGMNDDPFMFVFNLCSAANTPCARYIHTIVDSNGNYIPKDLDNIKTRVRASIRTKFITYCVLNPDLTVNNIYKDSVNELRRIKTSQLRLSSHTLAIETGRWSRQARELRLCTCGHMQTEENNCVSSTRAKSILKTLGPFLIAHLLKFVISLTLVLRTYRH